MLLGDVHMEGNYLSLFFPRPALKAVPVGKLHGSNTGSENPQKNPRLSSQSGLKSRRAGGGGSGYSVLSFLLPLCPEGTPSYKELCSDSTGSYNS